MIKFIKQHINSILWATIILILCGAPSSEFPSMNFLHIPHLDKIVHFGLYAVFTVLLISESNIERKSGGITKQSILIGVSVAVLFGLLIEILQMLVFTTRSAEFYDFLANTVGSITAVFFYRLLNRLSNRII